MGSIPRLPVLDSPSPFQRDSNMLKMLLMNAWIQTLLLKSLKNENN